MACLLKGILKCKMGTIRVDPTVKANTRKTKFFDRTTATILAIAFVCIIGVVYLISIKPMTTASAATQLCVSVNTDRDTAAETTVSVKVMTEEGDELIKETIACNVEGEIIDLEKGRYRVSVSILTEGSEYSLGIEEHDIEIPANPDERTVLAYTYMRDGASLSL